MELGKRKSIIAQLSVNWVGRGKQTHAHSLPLHFMCFPILSHSSIFHVLCCPLTLPYSGTSEKVWTQSQKQDPVEKNQVWYWVWQTVSEQEWRNWVPSLGHFGMDEGGWPLFRIRACPTRRAFEDHLVVHRPLFTGDSIAVCRSWLLVLCSFYFILLLKRPVNNHLKCLLTSLCVVFDIDILINHLILVFYDILFYNQLCFSSKIDYCM